MKRFDMGRYPVFTMVRGKQRDPCLFAASGADGAFWISGAAFCKQDTAMLLMNVFCLLFEPGFRLVKRIGQFFPGFFHAGPQVMPTAVPAFFHILHF